LDRCRPSFFQQPVREQLHFTLKQLGVVIGLGVFGRAAAGLDVDQRLQGIPVEQVRRGLIAQTVQVEIIPKVLQQEKPLSQVRLQHCGHMEPVTVPVAGQGQEGVRTFLFRGRVHGYVGLIAQLHPEVAPEAGIAGNRSYSIGRGLKRCFQPVKKGPVALVHGVILWPSTNHLFCTSMLAPDQQALAWLAR